MIAEAPEISLPSLALAAIPCLLLLGWMIFQALPTRRMWLGLLRMVIQLLLIGYLLPMIFATGSSSLLVVAMFLMTLVSAWIASGSIPGSRGGNWRRAVVAIGVAGSCVSVWILFVVLKISPGDLRTAIPLAGMIFSNAINSVSIAGERLALEQAQQTAPGEARRQAFKAAMIPVTNALFAVGVVSIPGMMTGQILDGARPEIAARYQIMVMMMVLSSAGLAALVYLAQASLPGSETESTG